MEKTRVIFRKEYNSYIKAWETIAFFPELNASYGKIQCYTSDGWTEASYSYYQHTRKASEAEYAEMYEYLKDIFKVNTNGDEPLQLIVVQKISTKMYDDLLKIWNNTHV